MTQIIEPFAKSSLTGDAVLNWLKSLRSGVIEGLTVTANGGFDIAIASGRLVNNGTTIYDDAGWNMASGMSTDPTNDRHAIVYAQYLYDPNANPASAMVYGVEIEIGSPTPPARPVLNSNQIKLADIFVPAGTTDLSTAKIVNTNPLPARGNADADVLLDRLVNSNANLMVWGGGTFAYATPNFTWSEPITIAAPLATQQMSYMTAPLIAGEIAGPGSIAAVGTNSIIFTVINRTTPSAIGSPLPLSAHVINLTTPNAAEVFELLRPENKDRIVWLALIVGGQIYRRPGMGFSLPAPDADPNAFLRNVVGGQPIWSAITEDLIVSILAISAFNCTSGSPASVVELGTTVNTPAFAATTINDDGDGPDTAQLTNDFNSEDKDVVAGFGGTSNGVFSSDQTGYLRGSGAITVFADVGGGKVRVTSAAHKLKNGDSVTIRGTTSYNAYNYIVSNVATNTFDIVATWAGDDATGTWVLENGSVVFTLTADDGNTPDTATANVNWYRYTYYGFSATAAPTRNNAFLKALEDAALAKVLRAGRGATIGGTPSASKYFFFAYPAWKGAVTSIIDNVTGFQILSAFTPLGLSSELITSESGIGEDYLVYRSNMPQTGLVNLTIG